MAVNNNLEQSTSSGEKNTKKKSGIKSLIKDLERNELIEVILELSKISKKNEQFIKVFIQGSNKEHREKIIKDAESKLKSIFFSRNGYPYDHINLKAAREIITQHSKILKGFPESIIELKLYYVELGVEIMVDWGDMYDSFYDSMALMLRSLCEDLFNHDKYYKDFSKHLDDLIEKTRNVGWGVQYYFAETIQDLKDRLGIDEPEDDENENK